MEKFEYVVKAFKEEPTIKDCKQIDESDSSIEYLEKGIVSHVYIRPDAVKLQFLGWELVLLENGKYYINDTSGG